MIHPPRVGPMVGANTALIPYNGTRPRFCGEKTWPPGRIVDAVLATVPLAHFSPRGCR